MIPNSVLITGGAGFIGSNLACHLRTLFPQAEIVCLDSLYRRGSELNVSRLRELGIVFHQGDIRFRDQFPAGSFDLLIECSAEPSVLAGQDGSPDYLFQTNLVGAYHCLEQARAWGSAFLFLSTSRVYPVAPLEAQPFAETTSRYVWLDGDTTGLSPRGVSEQLRLEGARSLYGFTKLAAENLIEEYRSAFGLRAVVNRCGVIAGPWQFGKVDQGVVALWVLAHVFKRPLSYIGYGGHGKQVRDVLHVADLCDLIALQIQDFDSWEGWLGNVSGGLENSISLRELTQLCEDITGSKLTIGSVEETRPSDLRLFVADCQQLENRSSWRPRRSLRQIVQETYEWVMANEGPLRSLL